MVKRTTKRSRRRSNSRSKVYSRRRSRRRSRNLSKRKSSKGGGKMWRKIRKVLFQPGDKPPNFLKYHGTSMTPEETKLHAQKIKRMRAAQGW